jgi:hypothetical protein
MTMGHSIHDLFQLATDIYSRIHPIWLWIASLPLHTPEQAVGTVIAGKLI